MSIRNVDLNSEEWCDLVFKDKNKEYGAYYLRKTSNRRHLFALLIVIVAIIVIILLSKIIYLNNKFQNQDYDYELEPVELSSLIWLEESNNNKLKAKETPPLDEIVKFTPPVITDDEIIIKDLQELQEINFLPDSADTLSDLEEDILLSQKIAELNQKEHDAVPVDEKNRDAEFQDGRVALLRYIYQNIQYPSTAIKQRINGKVICSFIVNEDGSISDVALIQGVYIFLDEEVIRVVRSMPLWNPAMKDGKPVKIKYIMPVVFRLN